MYFRDFKIEKHEIIKGDRFIELTENTNISYVKTDFFIFDRQFHFRGKLHPMKLTKYIISGHADHGITEEVFNKHQMKFDYWFSTNVEYRDPKLICIPIGITNLLPETAGESEVHKILGNLDAMEEVANEPKQERKDKLAYMNITINTYPQERQLVYDLLHDKSFITVAEHHCSLEGRREFLRQIRNHKFSICPRGRGIDTHRLWESLYMGTIPVTKRVIAYEQFADLPILFVDDWKEVTEEFLEKKYEEMHSKKWNIDKLKMSYWKNKIYQLCNQDKEPKLSEIEKCEYTYYNEKDSPLCDIMHVETKDINILKKMCDENEYCMGFNTLGYLKYRLLPTSQLTNINNSNQGLYIKNKHINNNIKRQVSNNYMFFKSYDIISNDIIQIRDAPVETLKKLTDEIEHAYAFNSLGFIKSKFDINKLSKSPFFKENDGIYINIDKYFESKKIN
jgi:hypothetical protein